MSALAITVGDVEAARARISGVAARTPVLRNAKADAAAGASLFFKCENLQRTGAFKIRGAYNALAQLSAAQKTAGIVASSSGNHAQGVALAGQMLGIPVIVFMPQDASRAKLAATRALGADVRLYDRKAEDGLALAGALAHATGMALIPPADHRDIMAGQGTLALELIEEAGPLDMLVGPIGQGGILSGCAVAAKARDPACRIVGVEPEAGNDAQQSFRKGEIVEIASPDTIADGAKSRHVGALNFPILHALLDDIVTVSDAALARTMRFFAAEMKMVVEPTGCLAAAAALEGGIALKGLRVGVIVSGGNVDMAQYISLLGSGEAA